METSQWIVVGVGAVVLILGGVSFYMAYRQKSKLNLMSEIQTMSTTEVMQLATPSGLEVELKGVPETNTPLVSPISQTACVYYRFQVEELRTNYHTDSDGYSHTDQSWETVHDEKQSVPFIVKDAGGMVQVLPDKAEFVAKQSVNDMAGSYGFGGDSGSGGGVLDTVLNTVLSGGNNPTRTSEWIIPANSPVYILGAAVRTEGGVSIRKGDKPFIISYKSEEELGKSYKWKSVGWLVGGIVLTGGGIAAFVVAATVMKK